MENIINIASNKYSKNEFNSHFSKGIIKYSNIKSFFVLLHLFYFFFFVKFRLQFVVNFLYFI
jgi:hypothetical protein